MFVENVEKMKDHLSWLGKDQTSHHCIELL